MQRQIYDALFVTVMAVRFSNLIYGEGFGPYTMIPVFNGFTPIYLLNKGDTVRCHHYDTIRIANVRIHSVTESVIIKFSNEEQVWVAADQRIYVPVRYKHRFVYELYPCYDDDSWRTYFFGLSSARLLRSSFYFISHFLFTV